MSLIAPFILFPAAGGEPPGPDDDFNDGSIASFWTATTTGSATIVETGGEAVFTCDTGTAYDWYTTRNAPRLLQDFSDTGTWQIDIDFSGGSGPSAQYQGHGILLIENDTNWMRFDTYHDGSNLKGFGAKDVAGSKTTQFNNTITSTYWQYLRLACNGSAGFTLSGSADGASYSSLGSFTEATVAYTQMAIFAHRSGAAGEYVAKVNSIAFS